MKNSATSILALTSFILLGTSLLQASDNDEAEICLGKRERPKAAENNEERQIKKRKKSVEKLLSIDQLLARDKLDDQDLLNKLNVINDFFKIQDADDSVFEKYLGALYLRKKQYGDRNETWCQNLTAFTSTVALIQMLPEQKIQQNYKKWFIDFFTLQTVDILNASGKGTGPAIRKQKCLIANSKFVHQIDFLKLVVLKSLDLNDGVLLNKYACIIDDIQNSTFEIRSYEDSGLKEFQQDLASRRNVFNGANSKNCSLQNFNDINKKTIFRFYQMMIKELLPNQNEDDIQFDFISLSEQKFIRDLANDEDYHYKQDIQTSKSFNLLSYFPAWISLIKDHGDTNLFLESLADWIQGVDGIDESKDYDFFIKELHAILPKSSWKDAVKKFAYKPQKEAILLWQPNSVLEEQKRKIRQGFIQAKMAGTEEEFKSELSEADKEYLTKWIQEAKLFPANFKELRNATSEEIEKIESVKNLLFKYKLVHLEPTKTVVFTEMLMKNNVDKCKHIYRSQVASVNDNTPLFLPHIILHPEQSDANLEMRVWGFYQMITSIFNDLTIRENAQQWINELSALCKGGLCMEARLKSLDTAYQFLKKQVHPIEILLNIKDLDIPQTRYDFLARAGQFLLNGNENGRNFHMIKLWPLISEQFSNLQNILNNSHWVFFASTNDETKNSQYKHVDNMLKNIIEVAEKNKINNRSAVYIFEYLKNLLLYLNKSKYIIVNSSVPDAPLILDSLNPEFKTEIEKFLAEFTELIPEQLEHEKNIKTSLEKKAVNRLLSLEGRKASDGDFSKDFLVEYISDILGYDLAPNMS